MKHIRLASIAATAAVVALSSCHHKDLEYDLHPRADVEVVYDWRNAPDASPASMMATFYPAAGGEPVLFTFAGRDGGHISIPAGAYSAIGINGDNTDWASLRHTDDPDAYEVYTRDAETLSGNGLASRAIPRAEGTEDERMALTPGMMWSHRLDGISIAEPRAASGTQRVTFYPEEAVCHYTVEILDISHPEYLRGATLDATLSGMAEGYLHGKRQTTDVAVTMPFALTPTADGTALHAEFLTFGECATISRSHILTALAVLTDGSKWRQTYDVTQQVSQAADPKHVHIIVRGLDLPRPAAEGGGFRPDVNDWNDVDIPLRM